MLPVLAKVGQKYSAIRAYLSELQQIKYLCSSYRQLIIVYNNNFFAEKLCLGLQVLKIS